MSNAKVYQFTEEELQAFAAKAVKDVLELAKAAQIKELASSTPSDLEAANALFQERPAAAPPAPSPVRPAQPKPKKPFTPWPSAQLIALYNFSIEKGFNCALYQYSRDPEKGKGHNAAYLVNDKNIGVTGESYQHLVDAGDAYRDIPVSELRNNLWVAKNVHLNKLRAMMKNEGRWIFNAPKAPPAPAPTPTPAPAPAPVPVASLERFEHCDKKQQAFLESIYALLPVSTWVKMTAIRKTLMANPLYADKSIKAFDAAIAAHLEKRGYVARKGSNADKRMIKRIK